MLPYLYPEVRDQEIFGQISPRLQALLSKTQNEIAKERKYRAMLTSITVDELEEQDIVQFYVVAGDRENHVCTKWLMREYGKSHSIELYVDWSMRAQDGAIVDKFFNYTGTHLATESLEEALEQAEMLTAQAHLQGVLNDANFDYISAFDFEGEFESAAIFYPITDVYQIAVSRCIKHHLDPKEYASRFAIDYHLEMEKYLLPEEFDYELDYEINSAQGEAGH